MSRPRIFKQLLVAAVCAQLILIGRAVSAAPINHGDYIGTNVTYFDVTEDTTSGDPLPLYQAPTVSGDGLAFMPSANFKAQSIAGTPSFDITDGKLNTKIVTNEPGKQINNLKLQEGGDYTLIGAAPGQVSVGATINLTVLAVNDVPVTPFILPPQAMTVTPAAVPSGTFTLPGYAGTAAPWSGYLYMNIDALLMGAGLGYGMNDHVTTLNFAMDNVLTAFSTATSAALIAKKDIAIGLIVNEGPVVPEPSSVVLALMGAVGLAWHVRRRRAK